MALSNNGSRSNTNGRAPDPNARAAQQAERALELGTPRNNSSNGGSRGALGGGASSPPSVPADNGSAQDGDLTRLLAVVRVKVDGANLDSTTRENLLEVTVENSLHLPDMASVILRDDDFSLAHADTFDIGKRIQIALSYSGGQGNATFAEIFDGEVTALELDMNALGVPSVTVRAFDRGHRLHRGRKRRTFVQSSDSDIVAKVAQEAGFTSDATATSPVHDWVMQHNQTDWEFLCERAARNGYRLYVEGQSKLCFKPVADSGSEVECKWGDNMRAFRPRMSASPQVDKVTVRGWDIKAKQAIVGVATTAKGLPTNGLAKTGAATAKVFGAAEMVVCDRVVHVQSEAEKIAQSVCDDIAGSFIEADGLLDGNPAALPGKYLKVAGAGTRWSGKYLLSATTHAWNLEEGYTTAFSVSGKRIEGLAGEMGAGQSSGISTGGARAQLGSSIVIGVVTNNVDPDNMGRVKVKFPWLDDTQESWWARQATPMAGGTRGFHFLPEVNDEVLVAFEHGDMRRPYILGSLWNGVDKPVENNDVAVVDSKVVRRTIKTRIGHTILLDDTDDKGEMKLTSHYGHVLTLQDLDKKIEAKTKDGHLVTLDDPSKSITVKTVKGHKLLLDDTGDQIVLTDRTGSNKMTIKSSDNSIKIECLGNFTVDAKGKVLIQGATGWEGTTPAQMKMQGTAGVDVKTPAMLNVEGTASASMKSSGILIIQGTLVKIN